MNSNNANPQTADLNGRMVALSSQCRQHAAQGKWASSFMNTTGKLQLNPDAKCAVIR